MNPLVTELWPQFTADEAFASCFSGVLVERVELLRGSRKVKVSLRSGLPLAAEACRRLCASLAPGFEGFELAVCNYFPFERITPESVQEMVDELREDGLPVNGFLDHARYELQGKTLTVQVPVGKNILESIGFTERLAQRIAERTGTKPEVVLAAQAGAVSAAEWEKRVLEKVPAPRFEEKKAAPAFKIPGLDLTDKPVSVFHGKAFKPGEIQPLKDLGGDSGKVTIWGDVFAVEVKGNLQKKDRKRVV